MLHLSPEKSAGPIYPEDLEGVAVAFELTLRYLHDNACRFDFPSSRDLAAEVRLPKELRSLLKRTFQVIRAHQEPVNAAFVGKVLSHLPELRAFAVTLEKDPTRADDLIQETVLKALAQHELFETGTNLRAWLFTILKNQFLTLTRRRKYEVEDATGSYG